MGKKVKTPKKPADSGGAAHTPERDTASVGK